MLDTFTADTFSPLLGTLFTLSAADGQSQDSTPIELVGVTPLGVREGSGRQPFSVAFQHRSQAVIGQGTYTVSHAQLGSFHLFIVPVAQDSEHVRYEAVFT